MKKCLFAIVFFLLFALQVFAQKSFIGQTKTQVKEYWKTEVSTNYFAEGVSSDTERPYFMICSECGSGSYVSFNPEFDSSYDPKTGKCVKNSFAIPSEKISVYAARFKKMGFVNDTRKGAMGWTDKKRGEFWTIEGNYSSGHSLAVYKW
jgi:hypothetical protein